MSKALTKYIPFSHYTDVTSCNMRREGGKKTNKKKINQQNNQPKPNTHQEKTQHTSTPIHSAFVSQIHFSGSEETTENHWNYLQTMVNCLQNIIKADTYRELTIKRLK